MKIASILVTYNRKELLIRNIKAQEKQTVQLDYIIIIDNNSSDNTYDYLKEKGCLNNIHIKYFNTGENLGGAGGFYIGIEQAMSLAVDYIWFMDDDGYPAANALENNLSVLEMNQDIVSCSSLVLAENDHARLAFPLTKLHMGKPVYAGAKHYKLLSDLKNLPNIYYWANFFNGALIRTDTIKLIGNINKKLFIKGDEVDYFFRLKRIGPVVTSLSSYYYHPEIINTYSSLKEYYYYRNRIYLFRKYYNFWIIREIKHLIYFFIKYLFKGELRIFIKGFKESFKL